MKQWNNIYKKEGKNYAYYDILEPHRDMAMVAGLFKKRGVRSVLDLGCGAGRQTWYLADNGFTVFGLDIAEAGIKMLEKVLRQKKLKADLRVGNIFNKLPYGDNYFDAVVSVQVLQHGREAEIKKAIGEIKRVLKPGGLVFITLCGRCSQGKVRLFLVKTAKKIAPHTYVPTDGKEVGLTHYIYNKDEIKKHFKDFKILKSWKDDKDYYCFIGQNRKHD